MSNERLSHVRWKTILFSLFILGIAGSIQLGCTDKIIGLDESTRATQEANEQIAQQVEKYIKTSSDSLDSSTISLRPFDNTDSTNGLNPPILPGQLDDDSILALRRGLEDEMNLTLTFRGADTVNIGTTGGQIELTGLAGKGRIKFPTGALSKTEVITARTSNSITEDLILYEFRFGPDGVVFGKSVSLELSATLFTSLFGKLPTRGAWMYLDEKSNQWQVLREISVSSDGNFHIPIEHFSSYRMVVTPAVGLSQGGQN